MNTRSRSSTLTVQAVPERFGLARLAPRSTQPEVFTFERIPAQATAVRSFVPIRPKRRCTRVMYPAKVRMHLPPPERSQAKRWLLVLVLVVLWQIYTEEPCTDTPLGGSAGPAGDHQGFRFQSAEEQELRPGSDLLSAGPGGCSQSGSSGDPNGTSRLSGPEPESRSFEQSAGNGYMVALLVYHRLGSDN